MKQTLSILTAVFAVLAFLVSCGGSEGSGSGGSGNNDSGETGSIYGIVTDKATGESIINAGVELQPVGLKTVTGSDGQFEFNEVATGTYTLFVTKTGYSESSSSITVESGKQAKGDVQLEKLPAALRIVDDAGNDISELDFGEKLADVSRQFNIFNDSSSSLDWDITKTAEWIQSISRDSGSLAAGDTFGIIVVIDRSLLRKGENTTQLHVTSNNGNKALTIKATAETKTAKCEEKPKNSLWNDDGANGTFSQTWDGTEFVPETKDACFSKTPKECAFVCATNYSWDETKCVADTRTVECEGLPTGASWNTASSISQTWNGTEWIPSNMGSYSTTSSTTDCRYICTANYTWDGSNCKADKKVSNCTGLPANAKWNTASTITQTWNGTEWIPTTTGSYSITESSSECRFVCKPNFFYDPINSLCINPCDEDPCSELEHATGGCIATDWDKFSCKCENTHHWDETKCAEGVECGIEDITPCIDVKTKLIWSAESSKGYFLNDATKYCQNLEEGGYTDWRLPNIDELRSLLNCSNTGTGGACKVSNVTGCLSYDSCWSEDTCGICGSSISTVSKFGKATSLGSSSVIPDVDGWAYWVVYFDSGKIDKPAKATNGTAFTWIVRCVRTAN